MIFNNPNSEVAGAINSLDADLAPVLSSMTADTALSVGDMRVYNHDLYVITSPIASGGSIIVGTNARKADLRTINISSSGTSSEFAAYIRTPDGTLIQWGCFNVDYESAMSQLGSLNAYYYTTSYTLPIAFVNNAVFMGGSSKYSTGFVLPIGAKVTTSGGSSTASIYIYDVIQRPAGTTYHCRVFWHAIGRWKL